MSSATCRVLLGHGLKLTREQSQGGCVEAYLNCKYRKGKWLLFVRVKKPLNLFFLVFAFEDSWEWEMFVDV